MIGWYDEKMGLFKDGWDIKASDRVYHYFINNRALCDSRIKYHAPYFDKDFLPDKNDTDYCKRCRELLKAKLESLDLKKLFKYVDL